jgi:hypothetical protein
MRTTVELSEPVYRRLKASAVQRGMRGFSEIVEEALSEYFAGASGELLDAIREAEGSWSEADVAGWERERDRAWGSWPTDPSSTQTS